MTYARDQKLRQKMKFEFDKTFYTSLSVRAQNVLRTYLMDNGLDFKNLIASGDFASTKFLKVRSCGVKTSRALESALNDYAADQKKSSRTSTSSGEDFEFETKDDSIARLRSLILSRCDQLSVRSRNAILKLTDSIDDLQSLLTNSRGELLQILLGTRNVGALSALELADWIQDLRAEYSFEVESGTKIIVARIPSCLLEIMESHGLIREFHRVDNPSNAICEATIFSLFDQNNEIRNNLLATEGYSSQIETSLMILGCIKIFLSQSKKPQAQHLKRRRINSDYCAELMSVFYSWNREETGERISRTQERVRQMRKSALAKHPHASSVLSLKFIYQANSACFSDGTKVIIKNEAAALALSFMSRQTGPFQMSFNLISEARMRGMAPLIASFYNVSVESLQLSNEVRAFCKDKKIKLKLPSKVNALPWQKIQSFMRQSRNPLSKKTIITFIDSLDITTDSISVLREGMRHKKIVAIGRSGTYMSNDFGWKSGEVTYEQIAEIILAKQPVVHAEEVTDYFNTLTNSKVTLRQVDTSIKISCARGKSKIQSVPFSNFILSRNFELCKDLDLKRGLNKLAKSQIDFSEVHFDDIGMFIVRQSEVSGSHSLLSLFHLYSKVIRLKHLSHQAPQIRKEIQSFIEIQAQGKTHLVEIIQTLPTTEALTILVEKHNMSLSEAVLFIESHQA